MPFTALKDTVHHRYKTHTRNLSDVETAKRVCVSDIFPEENTNADALWNHNLIPCLKRDAEPRCAHIPRFITQEQGHGAPATLRPRNDNLHPEITTLFVFRSKVVYTSELTPAAPTAPSPYMSSRNIRYKRYPFMTIPSGHPGPGLPSGAWN